MFLRKGYSKVSILFLMVFMTILLAAGCKDSSTGYGNSTDNGNSTPPSNEVWMQNNSFNLKTKTVALGTTIKWINKDPHNHTVTSGAPGSPNGTFSSGVIGSGGSFTYTFSTAGTFNYYCTIHQSIMTGTIVVQ